MENSEYTLTFKEAANIFLTSKEEGLAFNFFKGKNLLIAQLYRSKGFREGSWEGVGKLKKNSYVLTLRFSDKEDIDKFKTSKYLKEFRKIKVDGQNIAMYNFRVYYPFRAWQLVRILKRMLYSIFNFSNEERLEFEVVAY